LITTDYYVSPAGAPSLSFYLYHKLVSLFPYALLLQCNLGLQVISG
jgi:hypothetical protein